MHRLPPNAQFALLAAPTAWAEYADDLKTSADDLWAQRTQALVVCSDVSSQVMVKPQISRSYVLLAGFALENVFKGLIVAQDATHVQGGRLSKALQSHRIVRLASMAHESLEADELKFCALAEEAIPYWARYPIPLSADRLAEEIPVSDVHHAAFERIFARARYRLYLAMKQGWDSGEGLRLKSHGDSQFEDILPAG